jgi:hypothetical protein
VRNCETVYLPTQLSDSGRWTMLTQHESRITGAEMRYLRKCTGETRRYRVTNGQIVATLHQEPFTKMVDRRELRWLGHLIRLDHSRTDHKGPEGEQRYSYTLSLTSALDVGGRSTPFSGRLTPGKETRYPLYRRLVGPQGRSERVRKISPAT